ncbi:hypothetical protein BJ508DRAFT_314098 [Ascobolus immersus RN42]|uniref:Uncharacterized protein n=1 Tax=Ascobolus immersus RN42 TaxID=1160509 RepID=A0A3N4HTV7_ASCIM|nr:hypothetical protein BJ508DRAFT_314098 [Ascobolus immersus RN42]
MSMKSLSGSEETYRSEVLSQRTLGIPVCISFHSQTCHYTISDEDFRVLVNEARIHSAFARQFPIITSADEARNNGRPWARQCKPSNYSVITQQCRRRNESRPATKAPNVFKNSNGYVPHDPEKAGELNIRNVHNAGSKEEYNFIRRAAERTIKRRLKVRDFETVQPTTGSELHIKSWIWDCCPRPKCWGIRRDRYRVFERGYWAYPPYLQRIDSGGRFTCCCGFTIPKSESYRCPVGMHRTTRST